MNDITRQDLGKTLSKLLNESVCIKDALPYALQLTQSKVDAIINGTDNYNLNDMVNFIRMCGGCIEIGCCDVEQVNDIEGIRDVLMSERQASEMSVIDLAKKSRVSSSIIAAFEEGRGYGLRIDSFLKIINTLDIDINVY